jgi:hypothetical protein
MAVAISWYTDSPEAGDPACVCSLCGKPIPAEVVPVRLLEGVLEARFDPACAEVLGIVYYNKPAPCDETAD